MRRLEAQLAEIHDRDKVGGSLIHHNVVNFFTLMLTNHREHVISDVND